MLRVALRAHGPSVGTLAPTAGRVFGEGWSAGAACRSVEQAATAASPRAMMPLRPLPAVLIMDMDEGHVWPEQPDVGDGEVDRGVLV